MTHSRSTKDKGAPYPWRQDRAAELPRELAQRRPSRSLHHSPPLVETKMLIWTSASACTLPGWKGMSGRITGTPYPTSLVHAAREVVHGLCSEGKHGATCIGIVLKRSTCVHRWKFKVEMDAGKPGCHLVKFISPQSTFSRNWQGVVGHMRSMCEDPAAAGTQILFEIIAP